MIPLTLQEARQWGAALKNFDGTVAAVKANVDALWALRDKARFWPADLRAQHRELYAKGRSVFEKLMKLKDTRDIVRGWLGKLGAAVKRGLGLDELAAVPLIYVGVGIGVFVAALAAARSFLVDAQGFARRERLLEETAAKLIAQGVAPEQAYARAAGIAAQTAGAADAPGTLEKLGMRALLVAGIIAGLYFVVPKLIESYGSRRAQA